ncbi:hypothetical protein KCU76_g75, partial [Aureobasidium melanogenum]
MKAAVYIFPASSSVKKRGGPRNISARITPTMTVHPIITPCIRQPQATAGCKNSGKGRNSSFRKLSSVLRPLKGARRCRKERFGEKGGVSWKGTGPTKRKRRTKPVPMKIERK